MTDEISGERSVPVSELRRIVDLLRESQQKKAYEAGEATSAQSRKYNQGAAYAYAISANTIEEVLPDDE